MKSGNSLSELITSKLSPALRKLGFQRQGLTFHYTNNNNWGLISFQKSTYQVSEITRFTVNIGVVCYRLLRFLTFPLKDKKPGIEDCHWRVRLGRLINGEDEWWTMENGKLDEELTDYLLHSIEHLAVPEINKYLDDSALRDLWLSGRSPSLTEFQRLLYLSVLLKEIGPIALLEPTLNRLKQVSEGKRSAYTAEVHIRRLLE